MAAAKDRRNRDLAAIHVAKKRLGLDDDAYRDMLFAIARVRSAGDLDHAGRAAVLEHLRRAGFARTTPRRAGRRPEIPSDRAAQISKIEALLTDAGRPWAYLETMIPRICGVDRLEWCTSMHLQKLIAALVYDQQRRENRANEVS